MKYNRNDPMPRIWLFWHGELFLFHHEWTEIQQGLSHNLLCVSNMCLGWCTFMLFLCENKIISLTNGKNRKTYKVERWGCVADTYQNPAQKNSGCQPQSPDTFE